tara:strand:- start:105 stop:995 length:891 start_codon:yes stop_codon:yes gene_type:complete
MNIITAQNHADEWLPNNKMSYFLETEHHIWHLQANCRIENLETKKTILFIHGLGSSVITWRDILPIYSDYNIIALDLPGHGLTRLKSSFRSSISTISDDIKKVLLSQKINPHGIVGHSSGAAIALNLAFLLGDSVSFVVSINGSFENFDGLAGVFFPIFAKLLASTPLFGKIFSQINKSNTQVKKLLEITGSTLDKKGIDLYSKLIANPDHVSGTISMMAQWNHEELLPKIKNLSMNCLFISGENDRIVHPDVSFRMYNKMKKSKFIKIEHLGHLMHEENPKLIYEQIINFIKEVS